jgi:hypothetical protein
MFVFSILPLVCSDKTVILSLSLSVYSYKLKVRNKKCFIPRAISCYLVLLSRAISCSITSYHARPRATACYYHDVPIHCVDVAEVVVKRYVA